MSMSEITYRKPQPSTPHPGGARLDQVQHTVQLRYVAFKRVHDLKQHLYQASTNLTHGTVCGDGCPLITLPMKSFQELRQAELRSARV